MSDFQKDIETIKNPKNIKEALYASGPGTLLKAFEKDPTVIRLIRGGPKVIPLISQEIKENGLKLHRITLSCFAYILQKIDPAAAAAILKPLFIQSMKKPDPFFIYFAAHAIRRDLKLPVKLDDPEYSYGELQETMAWLERTERTGQGGQNA
jgi:hypothetical protein